MFSAHKDYKINTFAEDDCRIVVNEKTALQNKYKCLLIALIKKHRSEHPD
ncbi:hypothetical protein GPUN_2030 [Glaciecola punicea ACAM 611]|uniref:Uncharacterized protein n=1 Tax=Glaciecola punicea ACAM 611 TaxID=1121923 RepID=H5TCW8_9ALTE|nr:hypothetical protein GPUN_2030 [Glaciecola punicea ACAM 611]